MAELAQLKGLVLSIDGVQPEKGNETLYLIREIQTGLVLVARNLRSSASTEIEALVAQVKALQMPIRGIVSDKQHSICLAIERALEGIPHQLCHYHYLRDMAQPVSDADRHLKREIKKKVRNLTAIEESVKKMEPSVEKTVAGDYCLAIRTVMRQDGKYPLEPGGLQLYKHLFEITASIERALTVGASRPLERLARMLVTVKDFSQAAKRLSTAYEWVHSIAQLLDAEGSSSAACGRLTAHVEGLEAKRDRELNGYRKHIRKLTEAFAPKLFAYLDQPLLPRTNNELELFIGRIKKSRRQATGRKNTQEFIVREGQYVAVLYGLPAGSNLIEGLTQVDMAALRQTLEHLRRQEERSKAWRARRDLPGYLVKLEQSWFHRE